MFYNIFTSFAESSIFFNVFRYITFRAGCATLTSLIISFIIGPYIIRTFKKLQAKGQPIREYFTEEHQNSKKGTPTMGGVIILLSMFITTLLWADLTNPYIWVTLLVTFAFGLLGFIDDFLKVTKFNTKGVSGKMKMLVQAVVSIIAYLIIEKYSPASLKNHLAFPFFKDFMINLGMFYAVFALFVIVGSSNAVNLTDGLDGLAIVPIMMVAGCFAIISYVVGNSVFSEYLKLHHVAGSGELTVFCASLIGAGLGFLWYNAPPAKIFMGDTGSLSLGGALGTISIITKHEFVLAICGGLFVIETISVIIQVYYFKMTGGKRFFRMAPIHHHFEKKGWSESTVVIRFWIIAFIFALISLSTLKLR